MAIISNNVQWVNVSKLSLASFWGSHYQYWITHKQSKTGGGEGLGSRLVYSATICLESKDAIFLDLSSQEADVAALLQLTGSNALVFTLSFTLIVTQWINNLPYSAYFHGAKFSQNNNNLLYYTKFSQAYKFWRRTVLRLWTHLFVAYRLFS